MNLMPRESIQLLIEKIDRNMVSPGEAKEFAKRVYGIVLKGRTREQVCRSLGVLYRELEYILDDDV